MSSNGWFDAKILTDSDEPVLHFLAEAEASFRDIEIK